MKEKAAKKSRYKQKAQSFLIPAKQWQTTLPVTQTNKESESHQPSSQKRKRRIPLNFNLHVNGEINIWNPQSHLRSSQQNWGVGRAGACGRGDSVAETEAEFHPPLLEFSPEWGETLTGWGLVNQEYWLLGNQNELLWKLMMHSVTKENLNNIKKSNTMSNVLWSQCNKIIN